MARPCCTRQPESLGEPGVRCAGAAFRLIQRAKVAAILPPGPAGAGVAEQASDVGEPAAAALGRGIGLVDAELAAVEGDAVLAGPFQGWRHVLRQPVAVTAGLGVLSQLPQRLLAGEVV